MFSSPFTFSSQPRTPSSFASSSKVLVKNERYTVQSVEPFPRLVREALKRESGQPTLGTNEDGITFLYVGSQMFVWQLSQSSLSENQPGFSSPESTSVYSLTLPGNINVRTVSISKNSVLVVTTTGKLRYWPNLQATETNFDGTLYLASGSQITCVHSIERCGYLVGSTDGNLHRIEIIDGRLKIQCRQVQRSSGILGGLGLPSVFSWSKAKTNNNSVRTITSSKTESGDRRVFVLTEANFQVWSVPIIGQEKLVSEWSLQDSVLQRLKEEEENEMELDEHKRVWLLDIQATSNNQMFLFCCGSNLTGDGKLTYTIFELLYEEKAIGDSMYLGYEPRYEQEKEKDLLSGVQFILPLGGPAAYIVWKNAIVLTQVPIDERPAAVIELRGKDETAMGAGAHPTHPNSILVASTKFGIVEISQTSTGRTGTINPPPQSHMVPESPAPVASAAATTAPIQEEKISLLFNSFCSGEHAKAAVGDLTDEATLLKFSKSIIDARPFDPRWAEETSSASAGSSVIVTNQLEEKRKKHQLYQEFLSFYGVREKVSESTLLAISEDGEKLLAAIALRNLQNSQQNTQERNNKIIAMDLLKRAIESCLLERKVSSQSVTSSFDLFFQEVSRVDEILKHMLEVVKYNLVSPNQKDPYYVFGLLHFDNLAAVAMLQSATKYKDPHLKAARLSAPFVPWTSSALSRNTLIEQAGLTVESINQKRFVDYSSLLVEQLYSLVDILLAGFVNQLEALSPFQSIDELKEVYEKTRKAQIKHFVNLEKLDFALTLAEKYEDFDLLVEICDITSDYGRLEEYIVRYYDKNFHSNAFNWYLSRAQYSKLLRLPPRVHKDLSIFLKKIPHISWLHDIVTSDWSNAHHTLYSLATSEVNSIDRKKTLLSMSKLSAIASGRPLHTPNDSTVAVEAMLYLIGVQEKILSKQEESSLMTAEHLISICLQRSIYLGALDIFHNANLLLAEEKKVLLSIWLAVLSHDNWYSIAQQKDEGRHDDQSLLEAIQATAFFQVGEQYISSIIPVPSTLSQPSTDSKKEVKAIHLLSPEILNEILEIYTSSNSHIPVAHLQELVKSLIIFIHSELYHSAPSAPVPSSLSTPSSFSSAELSSLH